VEVPVVEQTKTADSSEQGQTPVEQVKQDMSETGEYSFLLIYTNTYTYIVLIVYRLS